MRELSKAQVRQRLRRRGVDVDVAEAIITSLVELGALNEDRLALAAARRETAIRGRGPARARLALKALGLGDTMRACWRGTASERPLFDAMVSVLNARRSEHADPSHSLTRSARVPASRGELATIAEESAN